MTDPAPEKKTAGRAFFLDRDGVIIEDANYISDPALVRLCPRVPEALKKIRAAGYRIIAVSNQSGIARGYFTWDELRRIEQTINRYLADAGASVDAWYYCPHHLKGKLKEYAVDCDCRKPKPGMLLKAAQEHQLDLSRSFMIGDKPSDLLAGQNAGCRRSALVQTGQSTTEVLNDFPDAVSGTDLLDAVEKLLALS